MTSFVPDRALMRRHAAAMKIIHEVTPAERITLLTHVILGSPALNEAVEEAERLGLAFPANRRRSLTLV